jgi:hypothetical protein
MDGTMQVRHKDKTLACAAFRKSQLPAQAEDEKTIDARLDAIIAGIAVSDQRCKPPA